LPTSQIEISDRCIEPVIVSNDSLEVLSQVLVNVVKDAAQSPASLEPNFQTSFIWTTLVAIPDKPKVFGSLMPDILNSDHFRVSFETVLTARKWPFYERAFPKQQLCQQITIPLIN
jgi:hypothetical protein